MLRVTHQGTFHMGVKERGLVSAHVLLSLVCGLWAVGSGCCLPVIVLASGGKAATWGLRRGDPCSHTPGQSSGSTRAEQPLSRQQRLNPLVAQERQCSRCRYRCCMDTHV